jgi:thiamine monophosphate kinase
MKEYELISELFGDVKDLFKSDAQIIDIAGQKWGITCDHFSLEEDMFSADNPYVLGSNLATAVISDLIASGCAAKFYQHAVVLANDTKKEWTKQMVAGINDVLKKNGCVLIGGDMGQADKFSYTGIALGPQLKKISRIFPPTAQNIYISGPLGDVNYAALTGQPTPIFELRSLPENALACIDTSSGFMDALWQLHMLNLDFEIKIENPPVKDMKLLFGAAGEYELLFTASDHVDNAILIGRAVPGKRGVFINGVEIKNPPLDPREYNNIAEYIKDTEVMVNGLFG